MNNSPTDSSQTAQGGPPTPEQGNQARMAKLPMDQLEQNLKAMGYDLDELERDNPYNAWMREI